MSILVEGKNRKTENVSPIPRKGYPLELLLEPFCRQLNAWRQATKLHSFTLLLIPIILAASLALKMSGSISWHLLYTVVICSGSNYAAAIMFNEYNDFKNGINRHDRLSARGLLVKGLFPPLTLLKAGCLFYLVSAVFVVPLLITRGPTMCLFGLVGFFAGYFYTSEPVGYKYMGLGDIVVALSLGPLFALGVGFAVTGTFFRPVLVASLPIAILVAAIVHVDNMKNHSVSFNTWRKSVASLVGHKVSIYFYCIEILLSYLVTAILIVMGALPLMSGLVLLSVPCALSVVRRVGRSRAGVTQDLDGTVEKSIMVHFQFGILLTTGVLLPFGA